jgi:hypothetical protein
MFLNGRGNRLNKRLMTPVALVLVLISVTAAPPAVAVIYEPAPPGFCERQTLHDYLRPLDRMPKLHAPAKTGQIGIGPQSLRLRSSSPFVVGSSTVGFTLAVAQRKPLYLPWSATASLVQVNGNGKPVGRPRHLEKSVGLIRPFKGDHFQFEISGKAALYRVTVAFWGASRQKLAEFGAYYRVLPPISRARLAANSLSYRPESIVFGRIENYGTLRVAYGVPFAIERLEGSTWVEAPESPDGPWILPLLFSLPGESGSCNGFWIPPSMPPGTYRMTKEVGYVRPIRPRDKSRNTSSRAENTLTAEFQVVP